MFLVVMTREHGNLFASYANKLDPYMFFHPVVKILI